MTRDIITADQISLRNPCDDYGLQSFSVYGPGNSYLGAVTTGHGGYCVYSPTVYDTLYNVAGTLIDGIYALLGIVNS